MVQYPATHTSLLIERIPEGKFRVTRVPPDARVTTHNPKEGRWILWQRNREHLEEVPMSILLGAFNHTHTIKIKRFTSHENAIMAGYGAVYNMSASESNEATEAVEEGGKKKRNRKPKAEGAEATPRGPHLTQIEPKALDQIKAARQGSKIAHMIDLLYAGVFADDLKSALERKGRALSGRVYKVHGYGIKSSIVDGRVYYQLVLPTGLRAPLEHVIPEPPKPPKAKAAEAEEGAEPKAAKPKKAKKAKAAVGADDSGEATAE
jgi:hypothetical protein